ncbi:chromosome loss-related protein [Microsporum audouinii]
MARQPSVLAPTAASLPDTFRIPSPTTHLIKALSKLSRPSLISLVIQWLEEKNLSSCRPYLLADESKSQDQDDETNPYTPAESVEELRVIYEDFQDQKGGKREIIDRILEGDWRHGLTLRQLAMADMRFIEEHPSSHRWTVLRIDANGAAASQDPSDIQSTEDDATVLPPFQASSFLRAMQREISPLVKAHYHVHRFHSLPLTLVRILAIDSPYQIPRQSPSTLTDTSRLIYLAFPDSTPFIYSSLVSTPSSKKGANNTYSTDVRTLRRIINDAVPKALSRPQRRYRLTSTSLAAKSLHTLLTLRGPWRTNSANGAFTVFTDAVVETGPLEPRLSTAAPFRDANIRIASKDTDNTSSNDKENRDISYIKKQKRPVQEPRTNTQSLKKRKQVIISRFGTSGDPNRGLSSFDSTPKPIHDTSTLQNQPALPQITPNPALDRLQIHLQDPLTLEPDPSPPQNVISLTFSGSDVVAGLRQLAELGMIDPTRMPSWMTGEEGVSTAVIRGGVMVPQ